MQNPDAAEALSAEDGPTQQSPLTYTLSSEKLGADQCSGWGPPHPADARAQRLCLGL